MEEKAFKKPTKRELFTLLDTYVKGECTISAEQSKMLSEFLNHELELLDRKKTSSAPSAKQVEFARMGEVLLAVLASASVPLSIADIKGAETEFADKTPQFMSALLRSKEAQIEKVYIKKIAHFSLKREG